MVQTAGATIPALAWGLNPPEMAGQSYCRPSIDWPEHATAGLHFLKEQSAGTLATTGPQGPARAIPFLSPLAAFSCPARFGDLRGASAFHLVSSHLAPGPFFAHGRRKNSRRCGSDDRVVKRSTDQRYLAPPPFYHS